MNYLIVRLSSLGNVAMTVPVVASLSAAYPEDTFVLLCRKHLGAMFFGMHNVEVVCADSAQGELKSVWTLWKELHRRWRFDAVFDLQDVWRTRGLSALFRLCGTKVYRVDYGRAAKRRLRLRGWKRCNPLPTEFERYAAVFRKAGFSTDMEFRSLPVNETARKAVVDRYGEKAGRWIGIAPFAKSRTNMLPYRVTKEILRHYAAEPDTRVYLFGAGAVECEMLKQWASLFENVFSVAGVLPLEEELELMRHLDVMLCMDSANQHLASLVALRAVSVWCGTHPYTGFYGWRQQETDRVEKNLKCRPCTDHGRDYCHYRNFLCKDFTAKEIIRRIEEPVGNK